jgi:hypothetical protein
VASSSNSKENSVSLTESGDGEIILSLTADAVNEPLDETLEFDGVIPSDVKSREEKSVDEEDTEILELATLSPIDVGSSVLGFWELGGYLWNLGLWRQPP